MDNVEFGKHPALRTKVLNIDLKRVPRKLKKSVKKQTKCIQQEYLKRLKS
jgi:hypothetical protein